MTDRGKPDLNRPIQIEHHISHMTSLSTTLSKVTAIRNDPGASPNDLGRVISLDPVLVGKLIARKWQLDEPLTCAIACHHDIDPPREEAGELAALVTPANLLANAYGVGSGGDEFAPERREEEILRYPGMSLAVMEDMRDIICEDIERAKIFLSAAEGKQG